MPQIDNPLAYSKELATETADTMMQFVDDDCSPKQIMDWWRERRVAAPEGPLWVFEAAVYQVARALLAVGAKDEAVTLERDYLEKLSEYHRSLSGGPKDKSAVQLANLLETGLARNNAEPHEAKQENNSRAQISKQPLPQPSLRTTTEPLKTKTLSVACRRNGITLNIVAQRGAVHRLYDFYDDDTGEHVKLVLDAKDVIRPAALMVCLRNLENASQESPLAKRVLSVWNSLVA